MRVAFELPPAQAEKLRSEAERLGLSPDDLARAAVSDLLSIPDTAFSDAAARVLARDQQRIAAQAAEEYRGALRKLAE